MEFSFVEELVHRLKVFQAMDKEVVTVQPDQTMRHAQQVMREARVSGMPVVEHDMMVGIVTIEDIIKALDHGHTDEPVRAWMTRDVVTVEARWPLSRAMSLFERTRFGRLPVMDEDCLLAGVITPESILRALLVELNRLLAQDEEREAARASVDGGALRLEFDVAGGDFDRAGLASVRLKRELASRGIDPTIARRVAIATHEAETNLIIHSSHGGRIVADLEADSIRLVVTDDGPGIEDIDRALTPGFSTASDFVRNLGFGAGMGLPNIRRCADHFEIKSRPGYGTRLNVRFELRGPSPEE
ncbi:MAG: CBS domain-containing protein [Fimbriimonadaceae bacterium]|nr:CBS domain-containing protein [Fimbriimonadaceae bacterium]